jgi:hypothetical protein
MRQCGGDHFWHFCWSHWRGHVNWGRPARQHDVQAAAAGGSFQSPPRFTWTWRSAAGAWGLREYQTPKLLAALDCTTPRRTCDIAVLSEAHVARCHCFYGL